MASKFLGTGLGLLGSLIFVGSFCSCFVSVLSNIDNDGTDPRQTLTANLLGYDRYAECDYYMCHSFTIPDPIPSGPYCCPLISSVRGTRDQVVVGSFSSVGSFLATGIGVWFELLLGLILMRGCYLSWRPDPDVPRPDPRITILRKQITELKGAIAPKQGELDALREELHHLEQRDGFR